jgi:cytoskeleton protein RodZ
MNDTSTISPELTAGSASPSANSAGQLLRQYRESTGLHIVALSSALKVARSKLEALEGDRLQDLPDVVFARALAMSCCRYLGKDAEPVLALMPGHAAQPTPALRQHLPPQQDETQRPRFTPSRGPFSATVPPWLVWVLVLVVIVVGGWFAAAPQRPVVKPPAAALDFPPQGVPGAEPVNVTSEPVTPGATQGSTAGATPGTWVGTITTPPAQSATQQVAPTISPTVTPGTSILGHVTPVPTPATPASAPNLRADPATPARN